MNKKEKARELWQICFNDNPDFTKLYFDKRYTDKNTIDVTKGEQMASVLQLLSYPFSIYGHSLPSAYISGACTHPNFRNQGVMQELLKKSLQRLEQENIPICTLIPAEDWLFNYYQKSGFETVFYNTSYKVYSPVTNLNSPVVVTFNNQFNADTHQYLSKKLKDFTSSVQHTQEDFKVILADLRLTNGQVFTARLDKEVVGMAIAYSDSEKIHVNEILTDSIDIKRDLFYTISKFYGIPEIIVTAPPFNSKKEKFGMLRIVQAKPVLDLIAQSVPDLQTEFYLEDSLLLGNTGLYTINKGKVNYQKGSAQKTNTTLSINELALKIFEPLNPYMSLMLD